MTNREALEKLYRQECISLPEQCGNCEKGKQSKCELYECYVQLRDAIELLESLKKHFYEEYQLPTGQHSLLFRINGTPEYKKIKEWLEEK